MKKFGLYLENEEKRKLIDLETGEILTEGNESQISEYLENYDNCFILRLI